MAVIKRKGGKSEINQLKGDFQIFVFQANETWTDHRKRKKEKERTHTELQERN